MPCRRLPLPKDVPLDFRVLPEYILEDVIDYFFFAVRYVLVLLGFDNGSIPSRHGPSSLELTGKEEVLIFTLTFMLSTWWIKNPFLKNKIIDVGSIFSGSFVHRLQPYHRFSSAHAIPIKAKPAFLALCSIHTR
jgi:ubiquitin conjugation factor E4 B